ncbi:hypothetical protein F8568_043845 [Actinomadura sp. LD22]|uniref:Small secreted protein n=1 Tax=Actinomadura physcomitrii TaxID=2650748 RepID=A0A6I4MTE6_9ACTN|nr:hypothetical protein [Actinomadura physcomitrii]MWA07157.1 hypothetical protein [Actinomadura physcomitrii]
MIRRLIIGTVLASVTASAAAGCGGDGGDKAKPEVAWAGKVCDGVTASGAGLSFPQLDPENGARSAKALAGFLDAMGKRLQTMETRLQGAGAPPVDNGGAALNTALANLRGTESAVRTASGGLAKAKVTDAKSFKAAVTEAGQAMRKVQTYQGPTKDLRADPALAKAFDQAGSCKTHQL